MRNISDKVDEKVRVTEKKIMVKSLITKIFMYSAMKIRAKDPLLYSVLKPETSSDSPSAKSKGVRLVSAKMEVIQTMRIGGIMIKMGTCLVLIIEVMLKDISRISALKRIRAILTS